MKINKENQFIDFRLITQSRKNHVLSCFVAISACSSRTGFCQLRIKLTEYWCNLNRTHSGTADPSAFS
ncbi:TPA: hypothetical protein I7721_04290 [Vibrio vulnificus]|nr:hypothetical protein [Vibrio vulnificus]